MSLDTVLLIINRIFISKTYTLPPMIVGSLPLMVVVIVAELLKGGICLPKVDARFRLLSPSMIMMRMTA